MSIHKYGIPMNCTYPVIRSVPDPRDLKFAAISNHITLPKYVNMTKNCPPVYDQSSLGSCTGNAIAAAYEFDMMKQKLAPMMPSRLFIYYNERLMEGDVGQDNGAQIRDGIKSIATNGVCSENLWPYDITQFAVKPSDAAYTEAATHKALKYYSVEITHAAIKGAIAQGYPVVTGISVYESFESQEVADTGLVPMPEPNEQCLGGHCVLIVGYSDAHQSLIVRNSWGADWGMKGYFILPYQYVDENYMMDNWVVTSVSSS